MFVHLCFDSKNLFTCVSMKEAQLNDLLAGFAFCDVHFEAGNLEEIRSIPGKADKADS